MAINSLLRRHLIYRYYNDVEARVAQNRHHGGFVVPDFNYERCCSL